VLKHFRNPKESGQELMEYALLLLLVAIVVVGCLFLFGILGDSISSSNSDSNTPISILNSSPVIGLQETNPQHVSLSEADRNQFKEMEYEYGCYKKGFDSSYSIRAGTEYPNPSAVRIRRLDDDTYSICVDVKGAKVKIVYELVKNSR
jgi:Flp pilus assembly pilin Flp